MGGPGVLPFDRASYTVLNPTPTHRSCSSSSSCEPKPLGLVGCTNITQLEQDVQVGLAGRAGALAHV